MISRLIGGVMTLGIGLAVYFFIITPEINSINLEEYSSAVIALVTILPIIYTFVIIFFTFNTIAGYSNELPPTFENWTQFGEKLKLAYAAKFGGRNKGFDEEVDSHIAIMNHLKGGLTKSLTKDWIMRMKRFTEADTSKLQTTFTDEEDEQNEDSSAKP